jgi:hypothetical protein
MLRNRDNVMLYIWLVLFKQVIADYESHRNSKIHFADKMPSYSLLKQVVCTVTIRFKILI